MSQSLPEEIKISTVEPHFILVDYDIKTENVRARVRHKLLEHGFAMKTESVYYGIFTAKLWNEIKQLKREYFDKIELNVTTSAHPDAEAVMLREQYEESFLENFVDVEEKLDWCDEAYTADPTDLSKDNLEYLKHDKETDKYRQYTPDEIIQRVRAAEYLIRELQAAVAKRKQREIGDVAAFAKKSASDFKPLEKRLREMDLHAQAIVENCKKRKGKTNKKKSDKSEKEDSD